MPRRVAESVGGASVALVLANAIAKRTFLYPQGTWKRQLQSFFIRRVFLRGLETHRSAAETKRVRSGSPHLIEFYHAVDDAHSHLLLQALLLFCEQYNVTLAFRITEGAFGHSTEAPTQRAWQRKDATSVARLYSLSLPGDENVLPSAGMSTLASRALIAIREDVINSSQIHVLEDFEQQKRLLKRAIEIGDLLFAGNVEQLTVLSNGVDHKSATQALAADTQMLSKHGHYLSGMIQYGGEFYWGIDRLMHLEKRLLLLPDSIRALTNQPSAARKPIFTKTYELSFLRGPPPPCGSCQPSYHLELFYSPRSPYSQLVTERVFQMCEFYGITLRIRPVFPMVMRKLAVPQQKGMYIIMDMKRESDFWAYPFAGNGFMDPLWEPTFRFFAVWPHAVDRAREKEFVASFSRGCYCEGLDFGTDRGMKRIVERAGLDFQTCKHLADADSRKASRTAECDDSRLANPIAKENIEEMANAGLWGVPCMRYGETFVWGQDRLWGIEQAIVEDIGANLPGFARSAL